MVKNISLSHIATLKRQPFETITVTGSPPGGQPPSGGGAPPGGAEGPGNSTGYGPDAAINSYDDFYYAGDSDAKGGDLGSATHYDNVFGGEAANKSENDALAVANGTTQETQISSLADAGDFAGATTAVQNFLNDDMPQFIGTAGTGNALTGFEKLVGVLGGEIAGIAGIVAGATQFVRGDVGQGYKDIGAGLVAISTATVVATTDPDVAAAAKEMGDSINYVVQNYGKAYDVGGYHGEGVVKGPIPASSHTNLNSTSIAHSSQAVGSMFTDTAVHHAIIVGSVT